MPGAPDRGCAPLAFRSFQAKGGRFRSGCFSNHFGDSLSDHVAVDANADVRLVAADHILGFYLQDRSVADPTQIRTGQPVADCDLADRRTGQRVGEQSRAWPSCSIPRAPVLDIRGEGTCPGREADADTVPIDHIEIDAQGLDGQERQLARQVEASEAGAQPGHADIGFRDDAGRCDDKIIHDEE